MTSYTDKGPKPDTCYYGFDHLVLWVSNAKQAASFYCSHFGYDHLAYRGLETGERSVVSHVVGKQGIRVVFESSLNPDPSHQICQQVAKHGDFVRDVAFSVEDARKCFDLAVKNGARVVQEPRETSDADGSVVSATIQTYGDCVHTFVERHKYKGVHLPGYQCQSGGLFTDPYWKQLPDTLISRVDHVVGNQPDGEMLAACKMYEDQLQFHRFWSVDDSQIHTEYSALRSIVMADYDEVIKMPINEPAVGKKRSQIEEYCTFHGGAGVQHIALSTPDIVASIEALRARGMQFLSVPKSYYDDLRKRLKACKNMARPVTEDLDVLERLSILVDFDESGYLLQIFTKPIQDRPTLFWEIIQRKNHQGFGAGNFKSLFEAIEAEQEKRGNL